MPHIVATLAPLDHYAGPIERREAFLSFLFYFDPRFVRIQGILDLCSIKSIHGNRDNIINYLVKSPHKLNYSEAITIFESYLADGYTSKGIYFTKLEGKTAIVVDDLTQKTNLTKFINKYWRYLRLDRSDKIPKTNAKIMSKGLIDFLVYDGFDVKTVTDIINEIFSEETGLDRYLKESFTEADVGSEKSYLKSFLAKDCFSEAFSYLVENVYNDPKKHCEMLRKRPLLLRYDKKSDNFAYCKSDTLVNITTLLY